MRLAEEAVPAIGRSRVGARMAATLLLVVVGVLLPAAGSASAAGWHEPVTAATGDGGLPDVAVDAAGDAVGVWARNVGLNDWRIMASTRPRGGGWSTPVDLSGDQRTVRLQPKVAVDPNGNAVAIWGARPPDDGGDAVSMSLWAASRSPGGAWSEPVEISVASGAHVYDVVIDGSGTATAIWHSLKEGEDDPPGNFVRAASRPLGGAWSEPVDLSVTNGTNPAVAANSDGDVTAVWIAPDPDTGNSIVRSKSRPAGGTWSVEAADLSSDVGDASDVQVAVDPQGDATAVWAYSECNDLEACEAFDECEDSECREGLDVSRDFVVQTAHRIDEGWSGSSLLWDNAADLGSSGVALAANPQGGATAVWSTRDDPDRRRLRSSNGTAEGVWSEPVVLSTADYWLGTDNLEVAVDPQGDATTIWTVGAGPSGGPASVETFRLEAVHRSEGTWGGAVSLSPPMLSWASLAVDPEGYVTALWSESQPFVIPSVRSAVFDAVAPLLNAVTVPESGIVGEPVAMSVDPFDVWPPVSTSWDFGDGGSGSGAAVSHCYSTPGERTVTVTGTDGAGNEASDSRTISIEPDPDLAPGSDPCAEPEPPEEPEPPVGPGPPEPPGAPDKQVPPPDDPDPVGPPPIFDPGAPIVSGLSQSHSRWRTPGARRRSGLPVGTTFRFRLDRRARVRLAFLRIFPRAGSTPRRYALAIAGRTGVNAYRFRGLIRGRRLARGRYRLRVTAHAAGERSAPASLRFTVLAPYP